MPPSSAPRIATALVLAGLASSAPAAVRLDVLDRCPELEAIYAGLATPATRQNCRVPRSPLERALIDRLGPESARFVCIIDRPPALFQDYTCTRPLIPKGSSISCFRPFDAAAVEDYKRRYADAFGAPVQAYLAAAKACQGVGGDTSSAQIYQFPMELNQIARFQFGFISGKGRHTDAGSGAAVHGFATVDPTLQPGAPGALEFVSVYTGARPGREDADVLRVGTWRLAVEQDRDVARDFNRKARQSGAPAQLEMISFDLEREGGDRVSEPGKRAMLEGFVESMIQGFEGEGFEEISKEDIAAQSGMSPSQMIASMNARVSSYGLADSPLVVGTFLRAFMSDRRPACTGGGRDGAIGLYLLGTAPIPGVKSDFGSLGLMILRLGACASSSSTATNRFVRGLVEDSTTNFTAALRSSD